MEGDLCWGNRFVVASSRYQEPNVENAVGLVSRVLKPCMTKVHSADGFGTMTSCYIKGSRFATKYRNNGSSAESILRRYGNKSRMINLRRIRTT